MKITILIAALVISSCGDNSSTGNRSTVEVDTPTATPGKFILPSFLQRNSGLDVLASSEMNTQIANSKLPAGYRTIPDIDLDDDGASGRNVQTRQELGRPQANCGLAPELTTAQRIADCRRINGDRSRWESELGNSGESDWNLVARANQQEIWIDLNTALLWSPVIRQSNWCNASGNSQSIDGIGINCSTEAKEPTCIGQLILDIPKIVWRLPSRNEFLQADLNGLRFVLEETIDIGFWTSTINSLNKAEAWIYIQKQGTLNSTELSNSQQVRCVGSVSDL